MFHSVLKNKYPFVSEFLEKALSDKQNKLYQAYLLTGADVVSQYLFALQAARILNCEKTTFSQDCDCVNCRWVKENKHPAVITVSPLDYTGDDGPKTVISVNQSRNIKKFLSTSSPYHRVIIFTDAQVENIDTVLYSGVESIYNNVGAEPPHVAGDDKERTWMPKPLTERVFQEEAANALLKTIEEPPTNVTFFFLSKDKDDVINTIVSRCQILNVSTKEIKILDTSVLSEFIDKFPPKSEKEAVYLSDFMLGISQQKSLTVDFLLETLQEYLRQLVEANIENKFIVNNIIRNINYIEEAKTQLASHINPKYVLDSLFLKLISK